LILRLDILDFLVNHQHLIQRGLPPV
jgi:hypothetical protein